MLTTSPVFLLVSIAYWSTAESIMRRSSRIRLACERLRAWRNPGTAIAASNAMIATTIMISTRVKPPRRLLMAFNMKRHQQTPRGLHPRGNHDRGCDHRVTRGDRGPGVPPGAQTLASQPNSGRSAHDRLSG